jgi:hypothetical protein
MTLMLMVLLCDGGTQGAVVAVSVSPISADLLVVSADKSGVVVLWRFAEGGVRGDGTTRTFAVKESWGIDSTVQCVKCSPYHEDEVAIGYPCRAGPGPSAAPSLSS